MQYFFPPQNQNFKYLQTNRSDILGSLWSSFNLDFQSNLGAMRLANKLVTNTTSSDDADLGTPVAFEYFDDRWWAICGTRIFKNTTEQLISSFSEDASTGAVTTYDVERSDLAVFNDRLWSSASSKLYSKESGSGTGAWTERDSTGGGIHQLAYFKKFNRLYYVDNVDTISSIDSADVVKNSTGDYFIDLGKEPYDNISCIKASSQSIWIGTRAVNNSFAGAGLNGHIFQWDGISGQVTQKYDLTAAGVLALCVLDDIPYALDTEGRVLQYTGSSFKEISRLPIDKVLLQRATASGSNGKPVHFNGFVATKNNTLLVLVNNINDNSAGSVNETLPSGIWELDLATGNFTHRYSANLKTRSSDTIIDFGQNRILSAGAIKMNTLGGDSSAGRSTLICGFGYYTDATTAKYGIFIDSPFGAIPDHEGEKRGYFVTTWFDSSEITDMWQKIWTIFRRFLASTDKIILKYRFAEETPIEATITWVDTTHFTTTTDISAYGPTQEPFLSNGGLVGGEVEVLQGTGGGSCSHITGISLNAGTYTVTLDNAVTGVTTGTAKARFQKWIKILPEITGQVLSYGGGAIGKSETQIQIKGVLQFTGDGEFGKIILVSDNAVDIE